MEYLPKLKIYLGKYNIFTDAEMEYLDDIKHKTPRYSPTELLDIFPEAVPMIKRNFRIFNKKKEKMESIVGKYFSIAMKIFYDSFTCFSPLPKEIETEMAFRIHDVFVRYPLQRIDIQVKHLDQLIKVIEWRRKPAEEKLKANNLTDRDIAFAKQIPISNFIEFNPRGFAKCPFHGPEKTPSLKYYEKSNRFHCFSCAANGDVIDFICKMYNLNFITAIKKLLNK